MDKYTILILLNIPFVVFGIIQAGARYKEGLSSLASFLVRFAFWLAVAGGLLFAKGIYDFLAAQNLTDSPPLSLADVILVTGVNLCIFLSIRTYARLDHTERKMSELQERLSILLSKDKD